MTPRILAVEYCPLDSIRFDPQNPRNHSKKQIQQIAKSIRIFGFNVPVLIDGRYQLIAGHGRVLAAQLLAMIQIPAIKIEHLTESQIRAFMIADNRLTENSAWDHRLLSQQLKSLSAPELGFTVDVTGFEIGEIEIMIEGPAPSSPRMKTPSDAIPKSETKPQVTQAGDVWILERHPARLGDAQENTAPSNLIGGQRAAAVLGERCCIDKIVRQWQKVTGLEAVHQGTGQTFSQRQKEIVDAQQK